jgi:hypothetical protein
LKNISFVALVSFCKKFSRFVFISVHSWLVHPSLDSYCLSFCYPSFCQHSQSFACLVFSAVASSSIESVSARSNLASLCVLCGNFNLSPPCQFYKKYNSYNRPAPLFTPHILP